MCALVGSVSEARADQSDPTESARAAYDEGARAYDARDFALAAKSFARADAEVPSEPALRLAMASALQANDARLAMELVGRLRGRPEATSLAPLADKLRARFSKELGRVRLVCPNHATCRGELDGRALEPNVALYVVPGTHEGRVALGEAPLSERRLEVGRGEEVTLTVVAGASEPKVARDEPKVEPSRGISPAFFVVSCALTAVGVAGGVGLTVLTKSRHDDFVAAPSRETADAGDSAQTATRVVWGITGAFAVTSGVLGFFTDFGGESSRVGLSLAPSRVALVGRF